MRSVVYVRQALVLSLYRHGLYRPVLLERRARLLRHEHHAARHVADAAAQDVHRVLQGLHAQRQRHRVGVQRVLSVWSHSSTSNSFLHSSSLPASSATSSSAARYAAFRRLSISLYSPCLRLRSGELSRQCAEQYL